jgi:hypothetical protein
MYKPSLVLVNNKSPLADENNKKRHFDYYSGVFQFNGNSEVRFLDAPPGEIPGTHSSQP